MRTLIILTIILFLIYGINIIKKKSHENFKSNNDYSSCIEKGFTKEFCIQNPSANFYPGTCICENGDIGYYIPGFAGRCVCG